MRAVVEEPTPSSDYLTLLDYPRWHYVFLTTCTFVCIKNSDTTVLGISEMAASISSDLVKVLYNQSVSDAILQSYRYFLV